MKRLLKFYFLLLFLSAFRVQALADPADPFFLQQYDNRNGLSNSAINYIFKDAGNLLWIATWDGLNMYDGTTFHVFNYSKQNDNKSIGSNVIRYITEDKSGNIWISTIEGISRYEKHTGKFYNYFYNQLQQGKVSEQEYSLAVDSNGMVYCLNQQSNLSYYNPLTDNFVNCALPKNISKVNKIAFDENNYLWMLGENGELNSCSVSGHQVKFLKAFKENKTIANFYLVNHQLLYSTADDKLFVVDKTSGHQKFVAQMKQSAAAIIFYKNNYFVAWATKGYEIFDNNFQASSFLENENNQMQGIRVTSWCLGSEDILWYGTDGNGIIKLVPKTKSFTTVTTTENGLPYNKSVRAFCEENGNLWVGTKGSGIIKYQNFWTSAQLLQNKEYYSAPSQLDNNAVYALKKGIDGFIYIGTDGKGIGIYDIKNKKLNKWSEVQGHNDFPEFGSVYTFLQDADSSVWLGTSGYGLIHLKINKDHSGNLSLGYLERFIFNNTDTGPANDIIYALTNGTANQLWIGCRYGGLNLFDKNTRKFKTYKAFTYEGSLSNNDVLSIYKDSHNKIWVGTSYGLNQLDNTMSIGKEPVFKKITTENGLPNNTIHAIEEDEAGNIWVSTNKGLAKISESDLKVWYYQQSDGLQSNEFSDGAVWKDSSSNLFFGGTYGFNYFLPQNIHKTNWQPNLLLSALRIGGQPTTEDGYMVLSPAKNKPLYFSIGRKDNFFELDLKAISFLNAEKCEYASYLEGYDKAGHYTANDGKVAYSNLSPGNYTLHIKWSNGDGSWTNEMTLIHLTVKQYFWLTTWAFLVYALLLSAIVYVIYSYRKNKLEIKHQLAVEHVLRTKEEEIHQNRLGFFTNIAHELQTPLTLIMGSSERFLDKTVSSATQKETPFFLSMIHQQASRLTYLVHQLLEFRKMEAGYFPNQFSYLNISELLLNLATPFIPLSESKGIEYKLNIAPAIDGWIDKDKLEKIIFNLLSNAVKYSEKKEEIIFSANENKNNNELEIIVANSGTEQLSADQIQKLFDQFYVVTPNTASIEKSGTGIGLAFTKQLVTMLNGKINVRSENGWTTFSVFLPLRGNQNTSITNDALMPGDKPSWLYQQAVTSFIQPVEAATALENNKQSVIDNLKDQRRKTVLIIEDEPGIRYLLNDILKDDYIIYEAEDGQKALEIIERNLPDLVISDVLMPNMSGLELCNKMKNAPATCQIPFILLSAMGSQDQHMEGYDAGADAYIDKPFHTAYLKLRVRKMLEYRQRLQDLFKEDRVNDLLAEPDMPDDDKQFLAKLLQYVEEKLDEPELKAEMIEKTFSISKMQLYRKLKTLTGMTPSEFIKHTRLKHAANLLITTQLTVSEIFYRTGFNNQSYFFREFKKRYNSAPNEFREQQSVHS